MWSKGEDVFNIEVDEDHSYVADGVVVHNCDANARRDVGFGPGRYRAWPISEAPIVPVHRRCRCYLSTVDITPGVGA